jgi:hypothetical protein
MGVLHRGGASWAGLHNIVCDVLNDKAWREEEKGEEDGEEEEEGKSKDIGILASLPLQLI